MTMGRIAGAALVLTLVSLTACEGVPPAARASGAAPSSEMTASSSVTPPTASATAAAYEGLLYGRVTTDDGSVYEGRLRWGGDEEALWGNYFNGAKDKNRWVEHAPPEQLPKERYSIEIFGFELGGWDLPVNFDRPFMARFGDIARIEPRGRKIRVTLRSGTEFDLDRFGADDLADGVRVWDAAAGVVDIGEWQIRSIEFYPATPLRSGPRPLHGTVRTAHGDFTGLVQWDREHALGSDELLGHTTDGELGLRFETIRSISRRGGESVLVTLLDGRRVVLSGTRAVGRDNRGVYVDDPRYGRVLISWEAFERLDFSPGGTGPGYGDFTPGRPLAGSVITRSGRRLGGRLVFDLDESETTETLDAPAGGVDYTIPFSLIRSVAPAAPASWREHPARVTLRSGEELALEHVGDLGEWNAGVLVFADGVRLPEHVPWSDVMRIDFDGPPAM